MRSNIQTLFVFGLFACLGMALMSAGNSQYKRITPAQQDSFSLSKGKMIYMDNCSGCHGSRGEGSFGPNLTDNYFLHGHHYHNIVHMIRHGSKKGMTAFHHHLKHHQIRDVAHYVMSLKGTNPPGAKGPEGRPHK